MHHTTRTARRSKKAECSTTTITQQQIRFQEISFK